MLAIVKNWKTKIHNWNYLINYESFILFDTEFKGMRENNKIEVKDLQDMLS